MFSVSLEKISKAHVTTVFKVAKAYVTTVFKIAKANVTTVFKMESAAHVTSTEEDIIPYQFELR